MPRAHQQRPQQDIAPLPDEAIEAVEPDRLVAFDEAWSPERAAVAQDGLGNAGVAALVDLGGDDAPEPAAGGFSWRPDPLETEPGTLPTSDLVSAWPALQAQAPVRLAKVADGVAGHLPVLPAPAGLTAQDPAASPPPALSLPAPQLEGSPETLDAIQPADTLSPALDAALAHTTTDLGAQPLSPAPVDGFIGEGLQLRPADGISLPELTAPELPPELDLSALTPALDARIAPHLAEAQAAEASMSSDAAMLQVAHLRELDALQDQAIAQQLGLREGALAEASQARTAWQAELNQSAAAAMQQTAEARQQTLDAMQVETARVNEQAGAAGFVDGVYDTVREGARGMFDAAQGAAQRAIAASQALLSRMVQGYARLVQAVLQTTLAAWPGLADRWCGVIQGVVDRAQGAIDAVADGLRSASEAVLGGLADGLDVMLALGQATWVGALTLAGLVVTGDWEAIAEGLHNLLEAAKTAPPQFESAAWEELLGVDLDQPLSPAELAAAGLGAGAEVLPGPPWTPENVGVDRLITDLQLPPELLTEVRGQGGEVEFGFSNDAERSMDNILGQQAADLDWDDGLDPKERARARWTLMKDGLKRWFAERWPALLGAGVLGLAGFIGLNVLTGGAATAALPVVLGAVGAAMGLAGVVHLAGHVRDFLEKGWAGDAPGGGKALAKAGAAGAIELAMLATMRVGGAAMKGAKAAARGAQRGAAYAVRQGKVILRGVGDSAIGRGARSLGELGERLLAKTRFRGFKLTLKGTRLRLFGKINPWVPIAESQVDEWEDAGRAARRRRGADKPGGSKGQSSTPEKGSKLARKDGGGAVPGEREIRNKRGQLIGRFENGSHLEIVPGKENLFGGNLIALHPEKTTTVTGVLKDTNAVARRGLSPKGKPTGITRTGSNPGAINILRSPKWSEIKQKHLPLLESGDDLLYWKTVTDEFWETVNKPWLEDAIKRGDTIRLISDPTNDRMMFVTTRSSEFVLNETGEKILSIFGREVELLKANGYTFGPDGVAFKQP
ncbi:MAG: hypothetical protein H6739_13600 [Alphaproteobacteria bacterium]|nr:hypothetical protein [Alphaproteobacteria bacterium]